MSTTPPMSPPPSSSGRKESINAKTPGKKRTNEEMSEPLAGSQASKTSAPPAGKAVNGLPKAAESGQETSAGDAKGSKNPDTEGAKNRNENGVIVASETKTPEQPFDPRQEIDNFNWQEFESRYLAAMAEQDEIQSALQEEFRKRINFFNIWAQSAVVHENERAHKRLKTRMHYVQRAERNLVEKRDHYLKVVKAFETALALLTGS